LAPSARELAAKGGNVTNGKRRPSPSRGSRRATAGRRATTAGMRARLSPASRVQDSARSSTSSSLSRRERASSPVGSDLGRETDPTGGKGARPKARPPLGQTIHECRHGPTRPRSSASPLLSERWRAISPVGRDLGRETGPAGRKGARPKARPLVPILERQDLTPIGQTPLGQVTDPSRRSCRESPAGADRDIAPSP